MRQSVVLLHTRQGQPDHFDWMIDQPGLDRSHRLITFRVSVRPDSDGSFLAQRAADHRVVYLSYEGELDQNRGGVERVAQGEVLEWDALPIGQESSIRARIRWEGQEMIYDATRESPDRAEWTFNATRVTSD